MNSLSCAALAFSSVALIACGSTEPPTDAAPDARLDAAPSDASPFDAPPPDAPPPDAPRDTAPQCDPDAGLAACGARCVDLRSDPAHCGACDRACTETQRCAAGVCEPVCRIGGVAYGAAAPNPANPCERCDPAVSSTAWTPRADGTDCGAGRYCASAMCRAGCVIAGTFYPEGAADPSNPCHTCAPASSPTAWTPRAEGATCDTGRVCHAAACTAGCVIGGTFRAEGALDPTNECRACRGATSTTAYSARPDGSACGAAQFCTAATCGPVWHGSTPAGLTPVYGGSSAASADGRVFLFGAYTTGTGFTAVTQIYNPATGVFTAGAPGPYAPYRSCAVRAASGLIYVLGGSPSGTALNTVSTYNPATNTWSAAPPMPAAADELACALGSDNRIYAFASDAAARPGDLYVTARTMIFNPATNLWTTGAPMPSPRQRMTAVTLPDGRIAVTGGNRGYIFGAISTLNEIYDPATNTWRAGAPQPVGLHWNVAALRSDGKMIITGGVSAMTGVTDENTYVYDPVANAWALGTPTSSFHYAGYIARTPDGRIYVLSGRGLGAAMSNVVDALY